MKKKKPPAKNATSHVITFHTAVQTVRTVNSAKEPEDVVQVVFNITGEAPRLCQRVLTRRRDAAVMISSDPPLFAITFWDVSVST